MTIARYKKEHKNLKHCLIVCGVNSLKYNWKREVEKFCKYEKAIILGNKINTKGKLVSISLDETKEQIDNCPKEFFWIINIERMRVKIGKERKENDDFIVDHINNQIKNR